MQSTLFVLNFFAVLFVVFYICKKVDINLLIPTIPSIFIWSYLMFAYIGILPLYFFWDDYRFRLGVDNQQMILMLWLFSSVAILIILAVFLFIKKVWGLELFTSYKEMKINNTFLDKKVKVFALILFALCILVILEYINRIQSVPLFELLKGASSKELTQLRSSATNNFSGKLHWYRLFYSTLPAFLSYFALALAIREKTMKNWIFFLLTFTLKSFTSLMNIEKAPLIWYIVGLVIVYLITTRKKINIKSASIIGGSALVGLVIMYKTIMGMGGRSLIDIIKAISSRTLTGQISPAYFYMRMFPEHEGFLLGRSFPNPKGIFPWDPYPVTVEVMNFMNPNIIGTGVVGSAPTVFWADMYANFSIGGIFLSSIIVGFIIFISQYILFKLEFNAITIAYTTTLIMSLKNLASTSLATYVMNVELLTITMLLVVFLVLNKSFGYWREKIISRKKLINENINPEEIKT